MTRSEREQLIRAHLEGTMSSGQEHDFFINVALDAELRSELKAHRTIESALRKDREVDPGEIALLQQSVMASLAAAGRDRKPSPAADFGEMPERPGIDDAPMAPQPTAATARWSRSLLLAVALLCLGILTAILIIPSREQGLSKNGTPTSSAGGSTPAPNSAVPAATDGGHLPMPGSDPPRKISLPSPASAERAGTERRSASGIAERITDSSRRQSRTSPRTADSARHEQTLRSDTIQSEKASRRKNDSLGIGIDLRIGNGQ